MSDVPGPPPPPLGTWPRFYGLVCFCAVLFILLLYWLTAVFNIPAGGA